MNPDPLAQNVHVSETAHHVDGIQAGTVSDGVAVRRALLRCTHCPLHRRSSYNPGRTGSAAGRPTYRPNSTAMIIVRRSPSRSRRPSSVISSIVKARHEITPGSDTSFSETNAESGTKAGTQMYAVFGA